MLRQLRILIVEDSEDDAMLLLHELEKGGYDVTWDRVRTAGALERAIKERAWDLVLSEYVMQEFSGLEALRMLKERGVHVPLIVVTGTMGEETAVEAMRAGARDCILKGRLTRLLPVIERELQEVNERRQAEGEIKQAAEQWQTTFDATCDLYQLLDKDYRITRVNRATTEFLGLPAGNVVGRHCFSLMHGTGTPPEECPLTRMLESRRHEEAELWNREKGIWMSVSVDPVFDQEGNLAQVVHIAKDITERKWAEEALRISEEKFRAIHNGAPIGIFQSTPEGQFLSVNPALAILFAYDSPKEMISTVVDIPQQLFVHPGQRDEILSAALTAQGFVRREIEYRRKDDSVFIANLYVRVIRDDNGAVSFLEGFVEDITERKQAEARLLESERKYRELVENANSIILRWGRDGRIKFMNEFGQKFFDYSEGEIIGRHVVGTIVPESDDSGRDLSLMIEQISADPREFGQNINENIRRNRERVWIAWANKPVLDDLGNVLEVFSVGTDITERRQAELELEKYREHLEELVEERTDKLHKNELALMTLVNDLSAKTSELEVANEKLKEVDRLKSMFIASMSHELRTPLNSVIGYSSVIMNEWLGPVGPVQKEKLAIVLRAGKHLLALINDVIDVSKIEAGQLDVHVEEFDLFDLVAEAANQMEPDMHGKGLTFSADNIHTGLRTDRRRLLQALLNLLSNAMKYTMEGTVRLTVNLDGQWAEIAVCDTGIGIGEQEAEKIFKPFVRIDSPLKNTVPGTGLGLYLTRRLVTEVLKGTTFFTSQAGQGSTFTIRVPVDVEATEPAVQPVNRA